jgi:hypothetical protein
MRVVILPACRQQLHDSIISLRGKAWVHIINLILPLVIEEQVPRQEGERSCIYDR